MVRCHGRGVFLSLILAGVFGCFVLPRRSVLRTGKLRRSSFPAGELKSANCFWQVATDAARDDGVSAATYLQKISNTAHAFVGKRELVGREDAVDCLSQLMAKQGSLCIVLGEGNIGKTLVKEAAIQRCSANLAMLSVDMRDAYMCGKTLMAALNLQRVKKSFWWVPFAAEITSEAFSSKNVAGFHELFVNNFIRKSIRRGKIPSIIVDEANIGLPGLDYDLGVDGSAEAISALAAITNWTKQANQASVMLISSKFDYQFRLMANGLSPGTISKVVVIGEVPESDMLKMLQEDWGMAESLAEKFYKYFGGDIYTTRRALDSLIEKEDKFYPYAVRVFTGLPSLVTDPEARAHLETIAKQGFSLLQNVEVDNGARLIAEANAGAVINKDAITFGLPEIFNGTDRKWAVIPSSYHMRMLIVHELENTPLPSSGRGGGEDASCFFLGGGILFGVAYVRIDCFLTTWASCKDNRPRSLNRYG